MSEWEENARRWRGLYQDVTIQHRIGHTEETVQAESQFRRLVKPDSPEQKRKDT